MALLGGGYRSTPYPPHGDTNPAQMIEPRAPGAPALQRPDLHYQAVRANPLFGRPSYAFVRPQGVLGPPLAGNYRGGTQFEQPRQLGTGHTARSRSKRGEAPVLPGFMSQNAYQPGSQMEYAPKLENSFIKRIPATLPDVGQDGITVLGTYRAHDFHMGERFNHQMRSAPNWQVMQFPPDFRELLQRQQVMRYQVASYTRSSTPLRQTDYFLGYYTQPAVAAKIGASGLGYMGSL